MPRAARIFDGLTYKEEQFCLKYVREAEGNASKAYRMAYDAQNMASETINEAACRLLQNSNIAARIKTLHEEGLNALKVNRESIVAELAKHAFSGERDGATIKALELAGKALGQEEGGPLYAEKQITEDVPSTDLLEAISQLAPERHVCEHCGKPTKTAAEILEGALG